MSASNGGTTRGRISLLAGSSLAAATVILSAGGAALAPTAALAANECTPTSPTLATPGDNGATADVYACTGASTYTASGITYSSVGALTVNSTGAMSVGAVGINLAGDTTDSVTFTATGVITGIGGPVIDVVATGSTPTPGPINITTAGITGSGNIAVTYGVQAVASNGAAINITNATGTVNVNSSTSGAQQQSAIRAVTTGGNGAVNISTGSSITGRVRGIEAQSSGTGALTITATNAVAVNTTAGVGVAAIDARTGTGLLTVAINTGTGAINGGTGSAILTNAGGAEDITVAAGRTVSATASTVGVLNLTAVGATHVTNAGTISTTATGLAIKAAGGSFLLDNTAALTGRIDLTGVTGASTVNNGGTWSVNGANNFGAGASTLANTGTLTPAGTSVFTGLEQFNNSGTITLGATSTLSAPGATFTGSGSSRLAITTTLAAAGSTACAAGIAGCLDLTGGTTAGVTNVAVTISGTPDTSVFTPNSIVLVNVAGGTSAAAHFVLDPTSTGYAVDPALGGVLATQGLFAYALRYDADTRQHRLVSAPRNEAFEFTPIMHEALSVWRATTDAVAGRQADLGSGAGGGAWVRLSGEHSERDFTQSFTAGGAAFTADNSYTVETGSAIAGFDLVKGGDVTVGVHGGYVKSRLAFNDSDTRDDLKGPTAGVYGSWRSGPLSLDGAFNANLLTLDRTSPTFEDSSTNVVSLGARAEAGWKFALNEAFFLQPLATVAYVQSEIEEALPSGYEINFEDVRSSSAALGLRAGGDLGGVGYWLVGRAWKEFSGDSAVTIDNAGSNTGVTFADDLSGDFQEVGAGLSLASDGDALRGYVSGGARLQDGIDNYSLSLGLRLRW